MASAQEGSQALQILQTAAAAELYHAQREVAHYFELGYLHLADHPDVAKEVRLTAQAARAQHLLTSGLMKKFTATAAHIVKTMIPMMIDAVELQDREIITDAFGQVIQNANNMKEESEKTQASYLEIQERIQNNLGDVNSRNKHVKKETDRIKQEMEAEQKRAIAVEEEKKELEDARQQMEDELKALKENRDRWIDKEDALLKEQQKEEDDTVLDHTIKPTGVMGAVTGSTAAAIEAVVGAVNVFARIYSRGQKQEEVREIRGEFRKNEGRIHTMMKEKLSVIEKTSAKKKEALDRLAQVEKLSMEKTSLGDVESLQEAALHLGAVDRQFTKIIHFWSNMAAVLYYLKEDVRSGEVYLKKIEDERYAKRFMKSIGRAETEWKFFGRICSDYVVESDKEIFTLYNFLSAPIDHMSKEDRNGRRDVLLLAIENDINNAVWRGMATTLTYLDVANRVKTYK